MYITEAYIQDKTGVIKAIWFNQPYLTDTLKTGQTVSLSGKISFDKTLCLMKKCKNTASYAIPADLLLYIRKLKE